MLEILKKTNPGIKLYSVKDVEFLSYGKTINTFDASSIIIAASAIGNPQNGSMYVPSKISLEVMPGISGKNFEIKYR